MNDKQNFLDSRTILAFALIILLWFGWSRYLDSQQPPPKTTAQVTASPTPQTLSTPAQPMNAAATVPETGLQAETTYNYDSPNWSFQVSSRGMGLRNIDIKDYTARDQSPIILGAMKTDLPFSTRLLDSSSPLNFTIEHPSPDTFVGHASVGALHVEKTMKVNPADFTVDTSVKVIGADQAFRGLVTILSEPTLTTQAGGLLSGGGDTRQDFFIKHDNTKTRTMINNAKPVLISEPNVTVAALSEHYFSVAVVDRSDLLPRFMSNVAAGAPSAIGALEYEPINKNETFAIHYLDFAGPKSFKLLSRIDEGLAQVVDYGFFAVLAQPILWLLKVLFSGLGNWGWAIIVLTIIVRAVVLPFNIYSFKSMKAMQRVQPEMQRVKEKYKDATGDQKVQMNQEIMALMKRNNANPMGGCLPMLIQLPVFWALYRVLGESIELYKAPFILWIHDLSAKDPYYVLPVLMGATMFVQQKMSPTAMDPQQAKIMVWMPVLFSFFMLNLPSGLTLYIFVSTLFGITQQFVFLRDKKHPAQSVKEAQA